MPTTATAPHRLTTLASLIAACLLLATPMLQAQTGDAQYFTEVAPGVVKDSRTGLEWMRCSLGKRWMVNQKRCEKQFGWSIYFTWSGAQDFAKKLNARGGYEGKADWRVPTVRELLSLRYCSNGFVSKKIDLQDGQAAVPRSCNNSTYPTIDVTTFPDTSYGYWSSTPNAERSDSAWNVDFGNGAVLDSHQYFRDSDFNKLAVRLVR